MRTSHIIEGQLEIDVVSTALTVKALERMHITHVVGLPDNGTADLYDNLFEHKGIEVVKVCREGEAFAIAAGLFVGGKHPLIVIQSTGFFESGDAIRGTVVNMKIPVVVLIGYRGYKKLQADPRWIDTAAQFLEPTLNAWQIPYYLLKTDDDLEVLTLAQQKARETSHPVAVLLVGKCTSE